MEIVYPNKFQEGPARWPGLLELTRARYNEEFTLTQYLAWEAAIRAHYRGSSFEECQQIYNDTFTRQTEYAERLNASWKGAENH